MIKVFFDTSRSRYEVGHGEREGGRGRRRGTAQDLTVTGRDVMNGAVVLLANATGFEVLGLTALLVQFKRVK